MVIATGWPYTQYSTRQDPNNALQCIFYNATSFLSLPPPNVTILIPYTLPKLPSSRIVSSPIPAPGNVPLYRPVLYTEAFFGFFVPYLLLLVIRLPTPPYTQNISHNSNQSSPPPPPKPQEIKNKELREDSPSPAPLSQDDISHQDNPDSSHHEQALPNAAAHYVPRRGYTP
jgi:hypothetical protein